MTVAAVIVRWRGGDEVDRCLRALLDHGGTQLKHVVLVDSGSGDGGGERLRSAFPEVEIVALDENRSFAHAANTGVASCREELIFLLNPDTEITDGALDTLAGELENRPRTAGAVPQLINPDGSSQYRWQLRKLPTPLRLAAGLPGTPHFTSMPTSVVPVAQPAAAAWLIRREVWRALDGFDERYIPAWWEDVDLCARLGARIGDPDFPARRGFMVVPEARVHHEGGSSLRTLSSTDFLCAYVRNLVVFANTHHPAHAAFIRAGLRLSLLGRACLRPGDFGAYRDASSSVKRHAGA